MSKTIDLKGYLNLRAENPKSDSNKDPRVQFSVILKQVIDKFREHNDSKCYDIKTNIPVYECTFSITKAAGIEQQEEWMRGAYNLAGNGKPVLVIIRYMHHYEVWKTAIIEKDNTLMLHSKNTIYISVILNIFKPNLLDPNAGLHNGQIQVILSNIKRNKMYGSQYKLEYKLETSMFKIGFLLFDKKSVFTERYQQCSEKQLQELNKRELIVSKIEEISKQFDYQGYTYSNVLNEQFIQMNGQYQGAGFIPEHRYNITSNSGVLEHNHANPIHNDDDEDKRKDFGDEFSFLSFDVNEMDFNPPDLAMSKCLSETKVMPFERKHEAKNGSIFEGISDTNYRNKQGILTNNLGVVGLLNRSGNHLGFISKDRRNMKSTSFRVDRRSFKTPL